MKTTNTKTSASGADTNKSIAIGTRKKVATSKNQLTKKIVIPKPDKNKNKLCLYKFLPITIVNGEVIAKLKEV